MGRKDKGISLTVTQGKVRLTTSCSLCWGTGKGEEKTLSPGGKEIYDNCPRCYGTGELFTDDGYKLIDFMRRYK